MARARRSRSKKKDKGHASLPDFREESRVILEVRSSPTDSWAVEIETQALSRFGASFDVERECNVGQLVNIRFPAAMADEFFDRGGDPLSIVCLVQQSNRVIVDGKSRFHISVAFVGETFPDSYNADPLQSYAVCGSHENGFFRITESEKPFKARRHPRFGFQLELTLVHIKKTDKTTVRAPGFTKNISVSGISVISTLEAQIGDKIKVGSLDLDFYGIAVVRNRRSLVGVENLLHLEFLDSAFPTSRVKSVLASQQEFA